MRIEPHILAAKIVQDAGGELVGRTRLQKIAFLLKLAGFGDEFSFEYRHFGPYSDELAEAMEIATVLGPVREVERVADWGGKYSIYSIQDGIETSSSERVEFVRQAKKIDPVELELAATAAYLYVFDGIGRSIEGNPWQETKRRKPTKASDERISKAASAYEELCKLRTVTPLPTLPNPV